MFKKDPLLKPSDSLHSPHNIIPQVIKGEKILVLDVGCNTGFIGKKIIEKNKAIVDGIDINKEALEKVEFFYRRIFKRDLSNLEMIIDYEKYDYVIFSDILEHLPRPDLVLRNTHKYLKDNGKIIISLPNIARLEIRLKLLLGNFDYAPGILSEDHLRFFTRKSAKKMIEECGYKLVRVIPTGFGHKLGIFTNLTAFQFIYVCKKNENIAY